LNAGTVKIPVSKKNVVKAKSLFLKGLTSKILMAATIQTLPAEVIDLIAAGEVIDSIAAAVRELVENSLDAGATRIVVSVWPQQWRVQVADNGTGMDLENLQQAACAHSTSKISSEADLYKIATLGFRGEALHSLAQLGCLEILSRPNDLGLSDFWENREFVEGETHPY